MQSKLINKWGRYKKEGIFLNILRPEDVYNTKANKC